MGYDKPDLGFVVHYQAPGSVIAYYQQVGRAGRGIERAEVVLLRGAEDRRIQDFFIEQAFPRREVVDRVLEHLEAVGGDGASTQELMGQVNLGKGRVEAMLKVLDVEGAVQRDGSRWLSRADSAWSYDAERYERITALRRREQAAMAQLGADGRCLMRALQEELDDPAPDGLRSLLGLRGPALRRAARRGAGARGVAAPALAPAGPRGQEDGAGPAGGDAQDPRGRPPRGGPRARPARRRRLGPARPRGPAQRPLRRRARRGGRRGRAQLGRAGGVGHGGPVAAQRRARAGLRAPARGAPRAALRAGARAGRRRAAAARDGQLPAAGRQRARRSSRSRARAPTGPACWSTTSASAAGRSRWSAASCAGAAARRSTRSRCRPRSSGRVVPAR